MAQYIHQARVRREVVVNAILDAKRRQHRSYVLVNEAKMLEKAKLLQRLAIPLSLFILTPRI